MLKNAISHRQLKKALKHYTKIYKNGSIYKASLEYKDIKVTVFEGVLDGNSIRSIIDYKHERAIIHAYDYAINFFNWYKKNR